LDGLLVGQPVRIVGVVPVHPVIAAVVGNLEHLVDMALGLNFACQLVLVAKSRIAKDVAQHRSMVGHAVAAAD